MRKVIKIKYLSERKKEEDVHKSSSNKNNNNNKNKIIYIYNGQKMINEILYFQLKMPKQKPIEP